MKPMNTAKTTFTNGLCVRFPDGSGGPALHLGKCEHHDDAQTIIEGNVLSYWRGCNDSPLPDWQILLPEGTKVSSYDEDVTWFTV